MNEPVQRYTMEEIFGANSDRATAVLDAQEEAIMLAKSMGEVRRIDRMARAKLRSLRKVSQARDYTV
jgi:Xaa-Pro aminopeptidase